MLHEIKREDLYELVAKFLEEKVSPLYRNDSISKLATTEDTSDQENGKCLLLGGLERIIRYCKSIPTHKVHIIYYQSNE